MASNQFFTRFMAMSNSAKEQMIKSLIVGANYIALNKLLTILEARGEGKLKNLTFRHRNSGDDSNMLMFAFQNRFGSENNEEPEKFSYRETIRVLLRHGVDVNYQAKNGDSALHRFFKTPQAFFDYDQIDTVDTVVLQLLLDADADVNIQNNQGRTALSQLFHESNSTQPEQKQKLEDIVNRFIQRGWNPRLDEGPNSPLAIARRKNLTSIVELLTNYYDQYERNHSSNKNVEMPNAHGGRRKTRRVRRGRKSNRKARRTHRR
jgi:ankyrin repeat protein